MSIDRPMFPLKLARAVSVVFHPLFIPLYCLAIIFSAPTLFAYLPFNVMKLMFIILLTNNVLVPLALLPFFMNRGFIRSYTLDERKERIIPLVVASVLYSITAYIVFRFQIPLFLKSFVFSASMLAVVITVITFFWKISVHGAGAGALTAVVFMLSLRMSAPLTLFIIGAIITSGLILASRLKLNSHNPAQVWGGFFTGLAGTFVFVNLF